MTGATSSWKYVSSLAPLWSFLSRFLSVPTLYKVNGPQHASFPKEKAHCKNINWWVCNKHTVNPVKPALRWAFGCLTAERPHGWARRLGDKSGRRWQNVSCVICCNEGEAPEAQHIPSLVWLVWVNVCGKRSREKRKKRKLVKEVPSYFFCPIWVPCAAQE